MQRPARSPLLGLLQMGKAFRQLSLREDTVGGDKFWFLTCLNTSLLVRSRSLAFPRGR